MITTAMTTMITTMMTTDPSQSMKWRPRIVGAAVVLLVAAVGCTSGTVEEAIPSTSSTAGPAQSTSTITTAPDPAGLLSGALGRYDGGYEFTATVTVNGEVASTVTGRWLDEASQVTVQSGDAEVEYLITVAGQWARLPDGEWELLEETAPSGSPLQALAAPAALDRVEPTGGDVVVHAEYPAIQLGLESGSVDVTLVFSDGFLVEASYETAIGEQAATSVTVFRPLSDLTPITAPSA